MGSWQAILFDFDGVLVDSEPVHYEVWCEVLKPFGIDLGWDNYVANGIGISDRQMLAFLAAQKQPLLDIELLFAEYPRKKRMFRERMMEADSFSPAVRELIAEVHEKYKTAVVTSSGRTEVEPILEAAGVMPYLDTCVYGGDVQKLKPAPDPYLLAGKRLGIERALVVEDSLPGETSGRAAGFDVLRIREQPELIPRLRALLSEQEHAEGQPADQQHSA